jgi:putative flippase GtrA
MTEGPLIPGTRPGTWRFVRSLLAGALATVVDLSTLTLLVELLHLSPIRANLPALLAGAAAQFAGSRGFVFRATEGPLGRQLAGFALVELGTLALNAVTFHLAVTMTRVPYPLARMACQFAVYVGFSYPLWTRVFVTRSAPASARLPRPSGSSAG